MIKWKSLIVSLLISLGTGGLAGFLTRNAMEAYGALKQPALAPPPVLFPIVWTILYVLMGISAYLIFQSDAPGRKRALVVYGLQLFVNFLWPVLFFNGQWYLLSFLWLMLLWVLILVMIRQFYRISPPAAWLQLPYFLWVTFAAYLNCAIWLLNR